MEWTADRVWRAAAVALMVVYVVVLVRTAWLCDDAYITLRTVDNFLEGHGLCWNVDERVQTYTHPLWMLLLTAGAGLTGEYYFTTLAICGLFTVGTVLLLAWFLRSRPAMLVTCLAVLVSSKAFVDFSTSGLENPLTHFFIALFVVLCYRDGQGVPRLLPLAAIAGLSTWNRMDSLLLFLPTLLMVWWRGPRLRGALAIALGFSPFLLWELFAGFYYGSPLPNTAYAKLFGTGIALMDLVGLGLRYAYTCVVTDPITPITLIAGIVLAVLRRTALDLSLAAGVLLSTAYMLRIGGDHMSGRMLVAPMFLSLWICASWPRRPPAWVPAGVLLLGAVVPNANLFSGGGYDPSPSVVPGIVDERGFYYRQLGMLSDERAIPRPSVLSDQYAEVIGDRRIVSVAVMVGVYGFEAGPSVHVVDPILCDPMLARLPTVRTIETFVANHLTRRVPEGYLETVARGRNELRDPGVAEFYDAIAEMTRGELFDGDRLVTALRVFRGDYDEELADFLAGEYRDPPLLRLAAEDLATPLSAGTSWQEGGHVVYPGGIETVFDAPLHAASLELGLDSMDHYEVLFLNGDRQVGRTEIRTLAVVLGGFHPYTVAVDESAAAAGYDRVRVVPIYASDFIAALGWLLPR